MNFWEKLFKNMASYDFIIIIAFVVTLVLYIIAHILRSRFNKRLVEKYEGGIEDDFQLEIVKARKIASKREIMKLHFRQNAIYGAFTTLISIFPLLGMIGTVYALLNLDLSIKEDISNNFLIALTSTIWGAFFGVAFKIADCFLNSMVEDANERYNIWMNKKGLEPVSAEKGEENEKKQNIS
ncbi:MAG: MotA/TolQ/ExbB proton channel family protein [Ruminococcus sp.]|nr:MotA/TolQ/ExbB proton channel family protein [Ruminococcus sp.]